MEISTVRVPPVIAKSDSEGKVLPVAGGKNQPPLAESAAVSANASERPLLSQAEKREPPGIPKLSEETIERLNEVLRDRERELEFSVDEGSGRTVIRVIHAESGEVIRQLPPEVILRFAEAFTEGSASLLDDLA